MILDTNAVSGILAGDPGLDDLLAEFDRHHLPTLVVGECRYGLERSRMRQDLEARLRILISDSIVLSVDLATTLHYAGVREELRRQGTPISENDVWIAALARQDGLPVVSRDGDFDNVPGLIRHSW